MAALIDPYGGDGFGNEPPPPPPSENKNRGGNSMFECPICGQKCGEATFEGHVDLCLQRQSLQEEQKRRLPLTSDQIKRGVKLVEKKLFALLDDVDEAAAEEKGHFQSVEALAHLCRSLKNARRVSFFCFCLLFRVIIACSQVLVSCFFTHSIVVVALFCVMDAFNIDHILGVPCTNH
jgi:hypothetical protein